MCAFGYGSPLGRFRAVLSAFFFVLFLGKKNGPKRQPYESPLGRFRDK